MNTRHFGPYNKKYLKSNRFLLPFAEIEKMSEEQIQSEHERYWNKFYDDLAIAQEHCRRQKLFENFDAECQNIIFKFDTENSLQLYAQKCANVIINIVKPYYGERSIKVPVIWIAALCYENVYERCDHNHVKEKLVQIMEDIEANPNSKFLEKYNLVIELNK